MTGSTSRTALIVDDESLVRMLMVDALAVCEYSVLEAADGPSGLRILQSDAHIDLLIAGDHLPGGITGRELAEVARKARPALTVLLVSALPGAAVGDNLALPERAHLLTKPLSMTRLIAIVRDLHK